MCCWLILRNLRHSSLLAITHSSAANVLQAWQDGALVAPTWLHHVGMGPSEGGKQQADTNTCFYFCLLTFQEKPHWPKSTDACACWKELFQGHSAYQGFLGALWLRLLFNLLPSVSLFFLSCFLGARSGLSAENRLFKVGLPRTQSEEKESPWKMFIAKT